MMRTILLVFGAAAFLLLLPSIGLACSCDLPLMNKTEKQLVELERKNNTAVFVGEVIEIIVPKTPSGKPALFAEVKFKVQKAWKGVGAEVVSVFTGNVCCICGFEFEVRETYLVYASGANRLTTSRCTRTRRLTDAEQDLKVLGKVKTPSKSKS